MGACTQQDGKDICGFDTGSSGPIHAEYLKHVYVHAHSRMARIFVDLTQEVVDPYMQSTLSMDNGVQHCPVISYVNKERIILFHNSLCFIASNLSNASSDVTELRRFQTEWHLMVDYNFNHLFNDLYTTSFITK